MSSGRTQLQVHAAQVSNQWPTNVTKLVKVALKTEDTVTQDTAQPHKWISDQHLWSQYSLLSIELLECGLHNQGIMITCRRGKILLLGLVLGPTMPPIQCMPGAIFPGGKVAGERSTTHTHLHLALRLKMH
jgi:hypothetical protein